MNQSPNPSQVVSTFVNLTRELEPFVKLDDVRIAFDSKGNVYIQGDDFQEQLHANFALWREVREEIRIIIAKHRS
ncbi:MAG: hypothetical protein WBF90_03960 [Rivularia sp. (in: cyanobacteria)]